jgi:hypothetical protein
VIGLTRRLQTALHLSWGDWAFVLKAVRELAIARVQVSIQRPQQLFAARKTDLQKPSRNTTASATQIVDRVCWAIGVASRRMPWRTNCLVQACAAQRWLTREGIATDLVVGVRKGQAFEAHAWLRHDARTVLGGDVSSYVPIIGHHRIVTNEPKRSVRVRAVTGPRWKGIPFGRSRTT